MRAREDRDRGIERAQAPHREAGPVGLGDRQDHQRRALGLGGGQDDPLRGVAEYRWHAPRTEALDDIRVGLDHDVRHAERLQRLTDGASDTAEAAQHDVTLAVACRVEAPRRRLGAGHARLADPARDDLDERGVDQNRHQRRGERRVVDVGADVARLSRHLDEDEGELPDLGEPDAHEDRGRERLAEDERHGRPNHELADDDEADQRSEQGQVIGDRPEVDEDADGDEEAAAGARVSRERSPTG